MIIASPVGLRLWDPLLAKIGTASPNRLIDRILHWGSGDSECKQANMEFLQWYSVGFYFGPEAVAVPGLLTKIVRRWPRGPLAGATVETGFP